MLDEIVNNNRFSFQHSFNNWEDAIKESYKPLQLEGIVDNCYIENVINCVKEYGPYIVISDDIAMPHSSENADGCNGTAVSFMKVELPVDFGADVDGEKKARLFFSLAADNHQAHMENIQNLMNILMNEKLVEELLKANNADDLKAIADKYNV